ncbi:TonB-dependent receptor domain-containing protein [Tsuneonella dongtanensis]|uniref:TonB-dependent receptor domain-containing protein n=1 Tax=Tsuneonella dongtanensis TaxID=692370 RepID=UPI00082A5E25|nr:TonB-dependent receptor [Tsuneonella dongtanensis]
MGERGHLLASYQYHDDDGIARRTERPYLYLVGVTGSATDANSSVLQRNLRQKGYPAGGIVTTGPATGRVFRPDGSLTPFIAGTPTGTTALEVGGEGGTYDSSLLHALESHQVFGRFDYALTDSIDAYLQASNTFKTNAVFAEYLRLDNVILRSNNPFLSSAQKALLAPGGATFRLRKTVSEGEDRRQLTLADSDQLMLTAGLKGTLGAARWQLDYVHGRSVLESTVNNNVDQQRLAAALDAVIKPGTTDQIVCQAAITDPARYGNCVAYNPFGPASESASALDYVFATTRYRATTRMDSVSGSLAGSPFSTWAGPVQAALSGEWRKLAFRSESDSTADMLIDCTAISLNCSATQSRYFLTLPSQPRIAQTVWEAAAEVTVPILRESAIAREFNLNGAVRFTHYDVSGGYVTWKGGLDWALNDRLRMRGTISRDIRAPTPYELYGERNTFNIVSTDLLTGASPTIPSVSGGNPALKAEIGRTLTGGIVWQASPGFSLAVDAYELTISDAIFSVNSASTQFQQACYQSGGSSPYCALQERLGSFTDPSPANAWTTVYNYLKNISEIKTWGVDLEMAVRGRPFGIPASLRLLAAYQPHLYFRQPNVADRDQAGAAFGPLSFQATPTVRLTGFLSFEPGEKLRIDIMQKWRNAMKISNEGVFAPGSNRLASFGTTALNLAWRIDAGQGRSEVFANIQNLFNAQPPNGALIGNGIRAGLRDGYAVGDDVRGRFFSFGVRLRR